MGFEGRVIFYAFSTYIKLQPPYDWLAVTLALFGFAMVSLARYMSILGHSLDTTLAGGDCLHT